MVAAVDEGVGLDVAVRDAIDHHLVEDSRPTRASLSAARGTGSEIPSCQQDSLGAQPAQPVDGGPVLRRRRRGRRAAVRRSCRSTSRCRRCGCVGRARLVGERCALGRRGELYRGDLDGDLVHHRQVQAHACSRRWCAMSPYATPAFLAISDVVTWSYGRAANSFRAASMMSWRLARITRAGQVARVDAATTDLATSRPTAGSPAEQARCGYTTSGGAPPQSPNDSRRGRFGRHRRKACAAARTSTAAHRCRAGPCPVEPGSTSRTRIGVLGQLQSSDRVACAETLGVPRVAQRGQRHRLNCGVTLTMTPEPAAIIDGSSAAVSASGDQTLTSSTPHAPAPNRR